MQVYNNCHGCTPFNASTGFNSAYPPGPLAGTAVLDIRRLILRPPVYYNSPPRSRGARIVTGPGGETWTDKTSCYRNDDDGMQLETVNSPGICKKNYLQYKYIKNEFVANFVPDSRFTKNRLLTARHEASTRVLHEHDNIQLWPIQREMLSFAIV